MEVDMPVGVLPLGCVEPLFPLGSRGGTLAQDSRHLTELVAANATVAFQLKTLEREVLLEGR